MGDTDDLHFAVITHPGFLHIPSRLAFEKPNRRKILDTPEAELLQLLQKIWHQSERVRAANTREYRNVFDNWNNFPRHFNYYLVRIPIRHQPGDRSPAGHSESTGAVNND